MSDRLNIHNEMRAFDRKDRNFYDSLTEEEQRKFSPYLMIRWGSSVEGSRELQEFYVISTNEQLNRRFFDINTTKHKKFQWLMATTVSPDMGTPRHTWISTKKKESSNSARRKQLAEIFPHYRDDEIDVMMAVTTQKDIDQYLKDTGAVNK